MKPIRLLASAGTVGFWTLASRVLGLARDIMIGAFIGPGPLGDAFNAAFRLPNLFRRFFAEGAFNAAFVPMFAKRLGTDTPGQAQKFAQQAFNLLATAVLALVGLGMVFMPALVWLTADGFVGDARFDLTVGFSRIMFPYILCMSLAALFSGVLNATGRFAAAAAAPVLLNILTCIAMATAYFTGGTVITWLVWTIPIAGIAQLTLVWHAARQAGISLRPGLPRWNADMRHMVAVALPAALAMGVTQVNLVIGQRAASGFEGAITWLAMADRLYQLPLGVVGIAVGIVLLPDLSRKLSAGEDSAAQAAFSRAGEFSLLLTIPSAVAFVVIPLPLVSVLYERGATGPEDSAAIALAVAIYGVGLPAFVLQKVLQPLYFAREDTKSPFRFALVAMVINAVLAIGLLPFVGWIAPAIAATVAGWAMVACLWLGTRRMGAAARFDHRFTHRSLRILGASLVMGAILLAVMPAVSWVFALPGWRYLALLALIIFGAAVYFASGQILGAFRLSELKSALRRGS